MEAAYTAGFAQARHNVEERLKLEHEVGRLTGAREAFDSVYAEAAERYAATGELPEVQRSDVMNAKKRYLH